MTVYIVLENAAAHRTSPDEMADTVLGIFSKVSDATECLHQHAACLLASSNIELFFEDGIAYDESGFTFFEIVARDLQ